MRALTNSVRIAMAVLGSACAGPATSGSDAAAPVRIATPHVAEAHLPAGKHLGPLVSIEGERVTMNGKPVGSVSSIDRERRLMNVDELFDALKAERAAWKAAHAGEAFPGLASLAVAPSVSGRAFASVFHTIAFAGYPKIGVAIGDRYRPTLAQVPGPHCGAPEHPCPSGPEKYTLHAQADNERWRLRVPRANGPLDENGDGARSSVESFREVASRIASTEKVGAIVLHVGHDAPFSRLGPFLAEAADISERNHFIASVTISVHEIDKVTDKAEAVPIGADGPPGTGLPPEQIQGVIRASFGEFRKCYERVLAKDPKATGKASTHLIIGRDGTVIEVQTTVTGDLPANICPCMEKVFRGLTFPKPYGGLVDVVYPIVFSPSD